MSSQADGAFALAAAASSRCGGVVVEAATASSEHEDVVVGRLESVVAHAGRASFAVVTEKLPSGLAPPEGWSRWFSGTVAGESGREPVTVLSRHDEPAALTDRTGQRCLAVIAAFNEEDILESVVRRTVDQGVDVYLIDNWSDDGTYELGLEMVASGILSGVERFPSVPSDRYEWAALLERKAEVAAASGAAWAIHNDADEVRLAPWPELTLQQGLAVASSLGFNAIDFTVIDHPPVAAEDPRSDRDVIAEMTWFRFGRRPGHFRQVKAWCAPGVKARLGAGHDVAIPDRLVFPFNFVVRHFPIRSQEHGRRKVFDERVPRWSEEERERGWHRQYDHVTPATDFRADIDDLELFDHHRFASDHLGEMVARVGLEAEPWD